MSRYIGVSAVYFLTRRADSRVYVWEPLDSNLRVLHRNVSPFGSWCTVADRAVAPRAGKASFLVEEVGRYSGLAQYYEHPELQVQQAEVDCDGIANALRGVLEVENRIDLLKIETEGSEEPLVLCRRISGSTSARPTSSPTGRWYAAARAPRGTEVRRLGVRRLTGD